MEIFFIGCFRQRERNKGRKERKIISKNEKEIEKEDKKVRLKERRYERKTVRRKRKRKEERKNNGLFKKIIFLFFPEVHGSRREKILHLEFQIFFLN